MMATSVSKSHAGTALTGKGLCRDNSCMKQAHK
jgi:hypothetical protein